MPGMYAQGVFCWNEVLKKLFDPGTSFEILTVLKLIMSLPYKTMQ